MPKQKLFDEESDEEITIKTDSEYSKKYDKWREKEEIHKLEQKYGHKALSSDASGSSDSEDESDEPPEVSEETEAQFLKTLALLKTKDPRIYDPEYKFFDEKKEKEQEAQPKAKTLTFEDSDEDDDGDGDGNIFTIEKKAEISAEKEHLYTKKGSTSKKPAKEGKLKEYLTGKAEHIDEEVEQQLAPLRALWSDPHINEGEAFLRDYILNQRYLEDVDADEAEDKLRDDEDLEEDEKRVEEQGQFERAYNFRFEEPDEEYLKRYPRTMSYVRPKDDRRSRKRAELRARKEEEKRRKMEEIGRLKALKLKEIHEKIARIKEVTGNEELAFKEEDIEGDFDPAAHDRRMREMFDEKYYGAADAEKPEFPALDDELEIENWDNYDPEDDREYSVQQAEDGPHCEDEEFNMDADYNPKQARMTLMEEIKSNLGKKPRNRKRKSKLAILLSTAKPKFIPTVADKTYSEYMEEYYKMDCEDVIGGDLPTRFKYREVVPNDFGLSVEEILLADDKELTQWVPLKKLVKHRPADVEKSEVNTYRQKAADVRLKRKILPSLFKDLPEEPEIVVPVEEATKKKKKNKKMTKNKTDEGENCENTEEKNNIEIITQNDETQIEENPETGHRKKKKKHKGIKDGNKSKYSYIEECTDIISNLSKCEEIEINESSEKQSTEIRSKKHKKKKIKKILAEEEENSIEISSQNDEIHVELNPETVHKKKKKNHKDIEEVISNNIHERTDTIPNQSKHTKGISKSILSLNEEQSTEISSKKQRKKNNKKIIANEISLEINGDENTVTSKNKRKLQKVKTDGFIIESIQKAEPSQGNSQNNSSMNNIKKKNKSQFTVESNMQKNNMKRKLQSNDFQVPNKKKKKKHTGNLDKKINMKDFKAKFKQKDKSSDNPLSNLSDERLKAYGLNPKKYRSFLKYKKF